MKKIWGELIWRWMPAEAKECVIYTHQLATNLFISLPASTKQTLVRHAQELLCYPTFIETGTFLGDMAQHASRLFAQVHTIELDPELAQGAARRFAGIDNIAVYQGDSSRILPELLRTINTSCVFWLDGHYSGGGTARGDVDTPIQGELEAIAEHPVRPHAILIDDARAFGTDDAYPPLDQVIRLLRRIDPSFKIAVSSDVIWAAPVQLIHFEWQMAPSGRVVPPSTSSVRHRRGAAAPANRSGGVSRTKNH